MKNEIESQPVAAGELLSHEQLQALCDQAVAQCFRDNPNVGVSGLSTNFIRNVLNAYGQQCADSRPAGGVTDANDICQVPPADWYCTRKAGHDGPCAAYRHAPDRELDSGDHAGIAKGMARINAATLEAAAAQPTPCMDCHGQGSYIGQHDGYDDAECSTCDGTGKAVQPAPEAAAQRDLQKRLDRAERALIRAGFQDLGGEEWKPPLGRPPRFIEVAAQPEPVAVVPEGWQPIETAPKDGSKVLLWLGAPWSEARLARWFPAWENWQEGEFPDAERDEHCGIGSTVPTGWMPLRNNPAPVAAVPVLQDLLDEYKAVVQSAYCQCDSNDELVVRAETVLAAATTTPEGK